MTALLLADLFRQIAAKENAALLKLNAITALLMKNNIPFDISYSGQTRKDTPEIQLTVYFNPSVSLVFKIDPGAGGGAETKKENASASSLL